MPAKPYALIVALAIAALTGCDSRHSQGAAHDGRYRFKPIASREYAPVTNQQAPTVAALERRGLKVVASDSELYPCGPTCDAAYDYAVFLGTRGPDGKIGALRFVCPNPKTSSDTEEWRCVTFTGKRPRQG